MNKEKLEKWLNKQIELRKKLVESEDLTEDIRAVSGLDTGTLHIYKGLGIIAETLGAELTTRARDDDRYPVERHFWYNDVKVFAIYKSLEEADNE